VVVDVRVQEFFVHVRVPQLAVVGVGVNGGEVVIDALSLRPLRLVQLMQTLSLLLAPVGI
jgi:hypothetical protein